MHRLPKGTQKLFAKWGRQGGRQRGQLLSPNRRSAIAAKAARVRWGGRNLPPLLPSVRLEKVNWDDPVYLEEVLAEGDLRAWRQMYHRIADHPFGATAEALARTVRFAGIYGATNLWQSLLNNLQGGGE